MKVIIEIKPYGDSYLVWRENVTATRGPMAEKLGATECHSKEEALETAAGLLPDTI